MARKQYIKNNKKKLIINLVIISLFIIASYILDKNYGFISDLIDNGEDSNGVIYTGEVIARGENELLVHFVNVGQGDCIIIELPDGKNMIIDGGNTGAKDSVLNFINTYGILQFDYLMLTHTDADHCGSLDDVITNTVVKEVYRPDVSAEFEDSAAYSNFLTAVQNEGLTADKDNFSAAGEIIDGGSYSIAFYTPAIMDYINIQASSYEPNYLSPIIILEYGGRRIMFTGDATKETEERFLDACQNSAVLKDRIADVDVLKVSHHGSNYSTLGNFLSVVKPEISVISVGENNYGHPGDSLLGRLSGYSNMILRTDLLGSITLKLAPDGSGGYGITAYNSGLPGSSANTGADRIYILPMLYICRKYILPL